MTIEPYQLTIYRRAGRLWVSPSVLTSGGFESLPGAIAVADQTQLATALAQAIEQVRAHAEQPTWAGDPYYVVAGSPSWDDFIEGLVAVEIGRTRTTTRIELMKPDDGMLVPASPLQSLPADAPVAELARVALELLAGA